MRSGFKVLLARRQKENFLWGWQLAAEDGPFAGMPRRRNIRVDSLKSDTLKFVHRICLACNSARTQPYDYAWELCSGELRAAVPRLLTKGSLRANWLFPYDTRRAMRYMHIGCCDGAHSLLLTDPPLDGLFRPKSGL